MCLLALFYRVVEDAPVVVGANREEYFARGGMPPQLLDGPVRAMAGIDPVAGGTWLGLNAHGVLIAVTNRPNSQLPMQPRSRGLLTRQLLGCVSAAQAVEMATRELDSGRYAGCNFLCADAESAVVIHAGDWLRVRMLPPGIHVLANRDLNDLADVRVMHALNWLSQRQYGCSQQCIVALEELCAQNSSDGPAIITRLADRGTVSSSIIAIRQPIATSVYLHAQGSPDRTPYIDLSKLVIELK
jgi:uncharacterized protein with NRDE domain